MYRNVFFVFAVVIACAGITKAYNILGVFLYTGRSHHYIFEPILNELANKGHNVTVVSSFPSENPRENLRDIVFNEKSAILTDAVSLETLTPMGSEKFAFRYHFTHKLYYFEVSRNCCVNALSSPVVRKLLDSDETFDAIIIEQFASDCSYAFAHRFKAPTVGIATHVLMEWSYARFGLPDNPAYVPSHHLGYGLRPNFMDRVELLMTQTFFKMFYAFYSQIPDLATVRKVFPDITSLEDIARNTSLLLINTFAPLTGSRTWTSNAVEIGGIHVGKAKPLNAEFEKFINDAIHGVIYVSFGSMVRASSMSQDKLSAFLGAFAELPQRVLWKWENDTIPGAPPNLMTKKWMPQLDILSHKNVKVFISHGGMLGTTEAIHTGVPMLTIPLLGDQYANAASVRESGLGLTLQYEDITKESLLKELRQLLEPEMQKNAERLSQLWHDRPMSPLDTAVYWIEYVARHRGAPHLRSAAVDLPLYQYLLLDVIAFLGAIGFVMLYISYIIFKFALRLCLGAQKSTPNAGSNKAKSRKPKKD